MKDLLSGLHARFIEIDAKEHDRVTLRLAIFLIFWLLVSWSRPRSMLKEHEMARRFAAGGFRDMTRIAEEEGQVVDLHSLVQSWGTILSGIEDFKERLDEIGQLSVGGNEEQIWNFFQSSA